MLKKYYVVYANNRVWNSKSSKKKAYESAKMAMAYKLNKIEIVEYIANKKCEFKPL